MKTLREIREQLGLTQADVARKINTSIPTYCTYELNQVMPPMETMVILERNFNQRIKWSESISPDEKKDIIDAFVTLSQLYPLTTVLNFVQSSLRDGIRAGRPEILINHYAQVANSLFIEPLIPPFYNNKSDKS